MKEKYKKILFFSIKATRKLSAICRNKIYRFLFSSGPGFHIGRNPKVNGFEYMTIGENVYIGDYSWIECIDIHNKVNFCPNLVISNGVRISDFVHIGATSQVILKKNVLIGSKVLITDHAHGSYSGPNQCSPDVPPNDRILKSGNSLIIGENVWVGDNVLIVGQVNIGKGCVIGAGSIITRDIPDNSFVVGINKVIKIFSFEEKEWLDAR